MINKVRKNLLLFILLTGLLMFADFAFASSTDGAIDSTYKYAWSENTGWINFGTTNGDVHITDSGLSGYALSETIGWINLENVTNDGAGNLSGYAWSENTGWINFAPANGGVIINSSGEFTGSALGENIGWIIFDCSTSACVKTDYIGQGSRPQCNNSIDDDNDGKTDYPNDPGCDSLTDNDETDPSGGGLPPAAYNPPSSPSSSPQNPQGEFKVLINNDEKYTNNQKINLSFTAGKNTKRMSISNSSDFSSAGQIPYSDTKEWTLTNGYGDKKVYVKFYTQYGQASQIVSDSIIYQKKVLFIPEAIKKIPEIAKKISEVIKEIPKIFQEIKISKKIKKITEKIEPKIIEALIPEFLKPKQEKEKIKEKIVILEKAPKAMNGQWNLLPKKAIKRFVLSPLPKEIRKLAEKFPELEKTFEQVGIEKITDIEKLKIVKLTLPGLKEIERMPSEIVFAKTGNEMIDFNIALTVSEKGEPQQKINTVSGKPLQLVVKPDKPVKSIKGYVVFKTKTPRATSSQFPFSNLAASLIFANPVFARAQEQPVRIEEKLVLLEFEYTDLDGDGIYTAEIQSPLVEGEYEIITVMDYEDPELGKKEIRLTTVVDPEGYIFERDGDKETRIPGAIVSIFYLNPETKQYELWPAKEFQQENPQITNATGKYSFLVPEGSYCLKVEAPGYLIYDGKPFQVREGSGVHINVELKTKYWYLNVIDWKTFVLILVIILLLYNFYRDKIRERILKHKTI